MNTTRNWVILCLFALISFFSIRWYNSTNPNQKSIIQPSVNIDLNDIKKRGILRVILEYNSISYFIYKGQPLGFEYELMKKFALQLGVKMEVVVTKSANESYNLLNEGKGDIIANGLLLNQKITQEIAYSNPYRNIEQVIVQRKPTLQYTPNDTATKSKIQLVQNIKELNNKTVYVSDNSIYYEQLKGISEKEGINIDVRILSDDRGVDDIIEAVANKEIDYTIANKDIALLNKSYFENLDVSVAINTPQNLQWGIRNNAPELLNNLNNWIKNFSANNEYKNLYEKYFNQQKNIAFDCDDNAAPQQGMISHYDAIIQEYSKNINWDWRLVAALIYQESKFHTDAQSWCGAQGLMQLMPGTARDLGISRSETFIPNKNIDGGTRYLKQLEEQWSSIKDLTQRIKFVLASYNAGIGHVSDAVRLAAEYGYPTDKWDGSVEYFMLYKSNPKFYTDKVVKYGYCRGQEPFNYVRNIIKKYFDYKSTINTTTATATDFRLEQTEAVEFAGIEGVYNPSEGFLSKSAKRELFLSHKLFDESNELTPKTENRNPFNKPKKELFVRTENRMDSSKQKLFQQNQLFQHQTSAIQTNTKYEINKLKERKNNRHQ